MKYIMFRVKNGEMSRKVPIIFPEHLVHDEVAAVVKVALQGEDKKTKVKVLSAGDIKLDGVTVSGKSTTLKVESNQADEQTIALYDYFHGVE